MPPATDRNGKGGGLARDKMTSVFQQKIKKRIPYFMGQTRVRGSERSELLGKMSAKAH